MKKQHIDPDTFNLCFPVSAISIFENGCEILRTSLLQSKPEFSEAKRGKVSYLSKKSLSRLAFVAANTTVKLRSLITLTYGQNYPISGKQTGKDRNAFLTTFQKKLGKVSYLWVLEFQQRGAPHLHILVSTPYANDQHKVMAKVWSAIAEKQNLRYSSLLRRNELMTRDAVELVHRHETAWQSLREEDAARRYIAKYAFKTKQKIVPREYSQTGRFWGHSRDVKPKSVRTIDVSSDDEARLFLSEKMNRADLAAWDILPRFTIRH